MRRVLLIEPDKALGKVYVEALMGAEWNVHWSQSAADAVAAADAQQPDIIVMEIILPGHHGIELLYELRSYADWRNIPVIIMTGAPRHVLAAYDKAFEELGTSALLYKPTTDLKTLLKQVEATYGHGSDSGATT